MRRPVVAGNWKMNGDAAGIASLLDEILAGLEALGEPRQCEVLVCPPHVYLAQVASRLRDRGVGVGAQDADERGGGAVTGAVAAAMIKDVGCSHVLVGHSERRTLFGEGDDAVAGKFSRCVAAGLTPVICVGETLDERRRGKTMDVVSRQLRAVMASREGFAGAMVAYEPVWAIGTGESATPEQAEAVHAGLRNCLAELDGDLAWRTRILYGGSVTPDNAGALFARDNVDGALVGGASLKSAGFVKICAAAQGS